MRAVMCGLLCVSMGVPLAAAPPKPAGPPKPPRPPGHVPEPRTDAIVAKLASRIREVRFEDKPLVEVLAWFEDQLGANVWVRWNQLEDVGVSRDTPISLHGRNIRLSQVLWMILREASSDAELAYGLVENILVISTASDIQNDLVTQVYDVRPLLAAMPAFGRPPQVRLGGDL